MNLFLIRKFSLEKLHNKIFLTKSAIGVERSLALNVFRLVLMPIVFTRRSGECFIVKWKELVRKIKFNLIL
jgi:hypothetical protein